MSLIILLFPIVMAAVISFAEDKHAKKSLALVSTITTFVASFFLSASPAINLPWLADVGISFALSGHGSSSLLVIVAALVMIPTVMYASQRITHNTGAFLALLLLMQTGLNGIFMAKDLVLFYIFFELTLIPSLVMLAHWGGAERRQATQHYMLYAITGSFLMLISIIAIKPLSGAASYHINDLLLARNNLSLNTQIWLLLGFTASFAVKLPLFPFHAWLPAFHTQNHPSGVADMAGTLYKVGGFGFFAWALPLLPEAALLLSPLYIALAAMTALYAAWIALRQDDMKRLLAYASLSHMGIVGVGIFSLHSAGLSGGIYLLAAQMVSTSALFLLSGMLHERKGTFSLTAYGGMAKSAPKLAAFSLFAIFASIGVPGLSNFPGEFMSLLGAFQNNMWLGGVAMLAVIAAGVYGTTLYQRIYQAEQQSELADMTLRDYILVAPLVSMMLFLGVFPSIPLQNIEQQSLRAAHLQQSAQVVYWQNPPDNDGSMLELPTIFIEPYAREDAQGRLQPQHPAIDLENFDIESWQQPLELEPRLKADGSIELLVPPSAWENYHYDYPYNQEAAPEGLPTEVNPLEPTEGGH